MASTKARFPPTGPGRPTRAVARLPVGLKFRRAGRIARPPRDATVGPAFFCSIAGLRKNAKPQPAPFSMTHTLATGCVSHPRAKRGRAVRLALSVLFRCWRRSRSAGNSGDRPSLFRCVQTVEKGPLATAPLNCRNDRQLFGFTRPGSESKDRRLDPS